MHRSVRRVPESLVDGTGNARLDLMVQQLWAPHVSDGSARVCVNPDRSHYWSDAESYWPVTSVGHARLLIPVGPRAATAGPLANYRRMRRRPIAAARVAASAVTRAGLPVSRDRVVVQVPRSETTTRLPLEVIASELRHPKLYASLGVRTGANRKATLQLVDPTGVPAGYAKLAWNAASRNSVSTETHVLGRLSGRTSAMRAPSLLAAGTIGGNPYLVTEPLPLSCRSPYRSEPLPTPQEFAALCPVYRRGPVAQTGQFAALTKRVTDVSAADTVGTPLAGAMCDLRDRLASAEPSLPIAERWHGDLAHWNTARDADGQLWCWDWEDSEEDVLAGLDVLHWQMSRARQSSTGIHGGTLANVVEACRLHLWAFGFGREHWPTVAALYVLTIAERACAEATATGWSDVWISKERLMMLLDSARQMIARSRER